MITEEAWNKLVAEGARNGEPWAVDIQRQRIEYAAMNAAVERKVSTQRVKRRRDEEKWEEWLAAEREREKYEHMRMDELEEERHFWAWHEDELWEHLKVVCDFWGIRDKRRAEEESLIRSPSPVLITCKRVKKKRREYWEFQNRINPVAILAEEINTLEQFALEDEEKERERLERSIRNANRRRYTRMRNPEEWHDQQWLDNAVRAMEDSLP